MSSIASMRHAVTAAFSALALLAGGAWQNALAQTHPPIRNVHVDVTPLRANVGEPTASWVEQELPGRLTEALSATCVDTCSGAHVLDCERLLIITSAVSPTMRRGAS
jgi:hypothetical protein